MEKKTLFIAFCNQKGGTGKTSITVLVASVLHYLKGKNVVVIDCDFPQHSLAAMRDRDTDTVNNVPVYQTKLVKLFEKTGKLAYRVVRSKPQDAIVSANSLLEENTQYDVILFDFPGTVGSEGVLNSLINMDYLFVPIVTDKMVMQSSLSFAVAVHNYKQMHPDVNLRSVYHFWNRIDKRENKEVYTIYNEMMERLHINLLTTEIPDTKKISRELSTQGRMVFRSTLFPPDSKLLKGSNVDLLVEEISTIINLI